MRLAKGQLTKGITKLDDPCKEMTEELPIASKVSVAATVIEALSSVFEKSIMVRKSRE